jgi:hypothetical protein
MFAKGKLNIALGKFNQSLFSKIVIKGGKLFATPLYA